MRFALPRWLVVADLIALAGSLAMGAVLYASRTGAVLPYACGALALALALNGGRHGAGFAASGTAVFASVICLLVQGVLLLVVGLGIARGLAKPEVVRVAAGIVPLFALAICNARALVGPRPWDPPR